MDAWTIFRRARIILFFMLVIICLAWATLLSILLAREWSYFSAVQRVVVLSLTILHGFTAILLYLMAVVVFHLWLDMIRVFTLLITHVGSAVLFTLYSPGFPCDNLGPDTTCRQFLFAIFIGCWVISGTVLGFAIALGIMTCVPRPVESLTGKRDVELPASPASFKAGSFSNEQQRPVSFHSVNSRTGLVGYDEKEVSESSLSPVPTIMVMNGATRGTFGADPPRFWDDNRSVYARAVSRTNSPTSTTSVFSGHRPAGSLYRNPFLDPSPPPTSTIYSPASTAGFGSGQHLPYVRDMLPAPSQPPALPDMMYTASPITISSGLRPLQLAPYAPYARAVSPSMSAYSVPVPPRNYLQPHMMYPDRAHTTTPGAYSLHSASASIHSKWTLPALHALPPPALTPGVQRPRRFSSLLRNQDASSVYSAPFGTRGQTPDLGLSRNVSDPSGAASLRSSESSVRQSYAPPVADNAMERRGSEGQVLDQAQWQKLVLNAAGQP
ncbi:hypothetical protein BC834DRAFT_966167 [Gloeopeniophorella convolvens]|nr:hypothetical protein BC834DRAFT_966167 [Gloeopeniophorella convolvens]